MARMAEQIEREIPRHRGVIARAQDGVADEVLRLARGEEPELIAEAPQPQPSEEASQQNERRRSITAVVNNEAPAAGQRE